MRPTSPCAQIVFAKVMNGLQQYHKVAGAPHRRGLSTGRPRTFALRKTGKYFAPYDSNGQLTEWASKALSANIGAAIGSKAGEKVGTMAAIRN